MTHTTPHHPAPAEAPHTKNTTDILGIISLGTTVVGVPIAGFIIGLIGASKAKKEGRSPVISRAGWVFGLVCTIFATIIIVGLIIFAILTVGNDKKFLDLVFEGNYQSACDMWGKGGTKLDECKTELADFNEKYTSYSVLTSSTADGQSLLKIKLKTKDGSYEYGFVSTFIGRVDRFEYGYAKEKDLPRTIDSV